MEILAIIPARGGSKGIPRKNIKLLCGKPLIAWTIAAAQGSRHITRTIVSTDDPEIAEVARAYGAEAPFLRPAEISGDLSPDTDFLLHALDFLKEKEGYEPDIVLRLPPTSPLRTAAHIDEGIETLLKNPDADAARPIAEAPKHPYKLWSISSDRAFLKPFLPPSVTGFAEAQNLPRQLFPPAYIHTGAMDVIRTRTLRGQKSTSGERPAYFFMPPEDSVNIDHPIDFEIAEYLMQKRLKIAETKPQSAGVVDDMDIVPASNSDLEAPLPNRQLGSPASKLAGEKPTVVAVSGGFDPVHVGHIELFREAKKLGDTLVVILNNDHWLAKKKRAVFMPELERKAVIAGLKDVDAVVVTAHGENPDDMSVCRELYDIRPDVFANGGDRFADNVPEVAACREIGCRMVFGVGAKVQSSSRLLGNYVSEVNHRRNGQDGQNGLGRSVFNFEDLFIFEMANNHQGLAEHGMKIVSAMADIAQRHGIRAAIKLQFRDLDTFIHPDWHQAKDAKHIPRFLGTRLSDDEFAGLVAETKRRGLITICTPFDEASVDKIERMAIEVIKIGSCSAHDWPLLERVAATGKPVICSTGGLTVSDIDKIVSFFQKRAVRFALMHCVAMYPTPNSKLHLNQIEIMRARYPGVTIGFSTHEDPTNVNAVRVAYAKGARIFEKHVGFPTDAISLNTYSATPEQAETWVKAYTEARESCGHAGERAIEEKETADLRSLMRGVWAREEIPKGSVIRREQVFFAMPLQAGQLVSGRWTEGMTADRDYRPNESLPAALRPDRPSKKDIVYHSIHAVKGMLNMARIPMNHDFAVELSHHYGIDQFHATGCTIVECFNREYAKKLIVQLPGQWNPEHFHKRKDETFHVLDGTLEVQVNGRRKQLEAGDTFWVPRGVVHGFGTTTGAIFEEVSTTNHADDSFYADRRIALLPREERKTRLLNWGQYQMEDITEEELTGGI
ncbi:MAG: N-acetylneuraminate synthase family protein [Patescibacteria group bacterium]